MMMRQHTEARWSGKKTTRLSTSIKQKRGTIESVLTSCISVGYGNCNNSDCKSLKTIVKLAEPIIGTSLPSIHDILTKHCSNRASRILKGPSQRLLTLLPSGSLSVLCLVLFEPYVSSECCIISSLCSAPGPKETQFPSSMYCTVYRWITIKSLLSLILYLN